jgi:hypothetical protein
VKISGSYQTGHDIVLPIAGQVLCVEVKAERMGFVSCTDGSTAAISRRSSSCGFRWRQKSP